MIGNNLLTAKIDRSCTCPPRVCSAATGQSTDIRLASSAFPSWSLTYVSYSCHSSSEKVKIIMQSYDILRNSAVPKLYMILKG